jgi:AmpD protein|tara:strand:- start:16077 stop:16619 length:543 start_codon:yes stop_codon:yes gene_type:complete
MNPIITMQSNRISEAIWVPSPHFDERPTQDISLIVIHGIALPPEIHNPLPVLAFFQGRLNLASDPYFFGLEGVRVSSHLVIGRLGDLYQAVEFDRRAWHSGRSAFNGRADCNDFSIGIELIGPEEGPFSDLQLNSLKRVCQLLCSNYEIPAEHIVGHCQVAPGRKVDPGADFPYERIRPN